MSLYTILGISPTRDVESIKKAYKIMAKKYHPDLNGNTQENTKKFHEISDAYNKLKNQKDCDYYYEQLNKPVYQTTRTESYNSYQYKEPEKNNSKKEIIGTSRLYISLTEAYHGGYFSTSASVSYMEKTNRRCHHCYGTGVISKYGLDVSRCPYCKGTGHIISHVKTKNKVNFKVNIPPFIQNKTEYHVRYKDGFIKVIIIIREKDGLFLEGNNIIMHKRLSLKKMNAGSTITFKNIDSRKIKLKIPAGTQVGQIFKLKDKGYINSNGVRGDLFIKIEES